MDSKELTRLFWNEHFNGKEKSYLSGLKLRVYNWLNKDNFGGYFLDHNVFWFEKTVSTANLPNYIYHYLIKWAERKGFRYLYYN